MKKILFNLLILIVILFSPSIVKAEEVDEDFHSRYSAKKKTYR